MQWKMGKKRNIIIEMKNTLYYITIIKAENSRGRELVIVHVYCIQTHTQIFVWWSIFSLCISRIAGIE